MHRSYFKQQNITFKLQHHSEEKESEASRKKMLEIVKKHSALFSGLQVLMMGPEWTAGSPENRTKHLSATPTLNMEHE